MNILERIMIGRLFSGRLAAGSLAFLVAFLSLGCLLLLAYIYMPAQAREYLHLFIIASWLLLASVEAARIVVRVMGY